MTAPNAIIEALKQNQWDLILGLIQNGCNVNCNDSEKNTPLHIAISDHEVQFREPTFINERKLTIEKLIEAGADINARNKNGKTPLLRAIVIRPELVETLLKYNPDLNASDKWGKTPLMLSIDQNISRLLLSKGANIDLQDNQGNTALMNAILDNRPTGVQLLLIYSKANIFLENKKKETALSIATKK
ncbi:MAG: ankyrin repeat domain-containing protein [Parachlamydiaceae bacterium]|nr:ankyrin repeat domain-containing protein [Parachlamydiaceae bacterium]